MAAVPTRTESTAAPVPIQAEPVSATRCRFVVGRPVYPDRWVYFAEVANARGSPLAERVFSVEGVASVLIAHDTLTVIRPHPKGWPVLGPAVRVLRALVSGAEADSGSWADLARRVGQAIRAHIDAGDPAVADPLPFAVPSPAALRVRVQAVLDEQINPVIAGHGGGVEIVDVKDNVLYLTMRGGCQGCGLKDLTLKHGVEAAVRDAVPEIGPIFDLTDHAAGTNPYRSRRPAF